MEYTHHNDSIEIVFQIQIYNLKFRITRYMITCSGDKVKYKYLWNDYEFNRVINN